MSRKQLREDINQLKSRVDTITPNEEKVAYEIHNYICDKNPEIKNALKEMADYMALHGLFDFVDGAEPNPEILEHRKYMELHKRYDKLSIEGYEKLTEDDWNIIDKSIRNRCH